MEPSGTIEGTTNVYPKNLEETLYIFGENGTVKIGGTSTNNIDVWDFSDETEEDIQNKNSKRLQAMYMVMAILVCLLMLWML